MLHIYGFWRSQATYRLRVALRLKQIDYRETPINLDNGAQNDPEFRSINPFGTVPALQLDGRLLTQSLAMLEYLEETRPQPLLLPADPLGRARVRALAAIAASDTHPLIVPRVRRYLSETAGFDAAQWKSWQTRWFGLGLEGFEARLKEAETGAFCHGDTPTFADICLVGLYAGAETFAIERPFVPIVERIVARCRTLPAFRDSAAEHQADYPHPPSRSA